MFAASAAASHALPPVIGSWNPASAGGKAAKIATIAVAQISASLAGSWAGEQGAKYIYNKA